MIRAAVIAGFGIIAAFASLLSAQTKPPVYGYTVVNSFPHDPQAFTQGLIVRDGVLYESTGLNGQSSLRKVRLETGEVLQRISVDGRYFAEGMTDWGDRLIQLTYTTKIGFVTPNGWRPGCTGSSPRSPNAALITKQPVAFAWIGT